MAPNILVRKGNEIVASECRIKCKIRLGAFDDELIARIVVVGANGVDTEAECLAYGKSVETTRRPSSREEVDGALHVYLLERQGQLVSVVLPQSTFQNGPSVIVRESSLM